MQTKETVRLGFLDTIVAEYEADNVKNGRPYTNRILDAGAIVAKHGVVRVAKGEYKVESSGDGHTKYRVNGTCSCPDGKPGPDGQSKAPHGWCKHRMAVRIEVRVEARLKELTDLSVPHSHTWDCDEHRDLPVECWARCCPDPTRIPCATCASTAHTDESEPPFVDTATGEILAEEPPMMTTIGETIKHVVASLHGHANGLCVRHTPDAPPDAPPDVPLTTTEYEVSTYKPPTPKLPEAPVAMCLTLRLPENHQLTYTLRGMTDADVLDRLPGVLARLEKIMHTEVDYELNFIQRLVRAFVPKKTTYQGK